MKKISLKNLNLNEVESLSREQLKNVMGGQNGSGSGASNCGVKIDGEWRRFGEDVPNGSGMELGQKYVKNGWATNYCCDSCPWNK